MLTYEAKNDALAKKESKRLLKDQRPTQDLCAEGWQQQLKPFSVGDVVPRTLWVKLARLLIQQVHAK